MSPDVAARTCIWLHQLPRPKLEPGSSPMSHAVVDGRLPIDWPMILKGWLAIARLSATLVGQAGHPRQHLDEVGWLGLRVEGFSKHLDHAAGAEQVAERAVDR